MLISKFSGHAVNTEAEIAAFEARYQISLPAQYRSFLMRYNGGETPQTKFKIGRESSDIRAFLGFGDVPYRFPAEDEMSEWLQKELLPIAVDSFGNYAAIGISEKHSGVIYFCDHERGYKSKKLAKSFSEFIAQCKSKKLGKIRTIAEREQQVLENGWTSEEITDDVRAVWQAEIDKYQHIVQETVVLDEIG